MNISGKNDDISIGLRNVDPAKFQMQISKYMQTHKAYSKARMAGVYRPRAGVANGKSMEKPKCAAKV